MGCYDRSADIWSLGCVIHEMCTLRIAFSYEDVASIQHAILCVYFSGLRYGSCADRYYDNSTGQRTCAIHPSYGDLVGLVDSMLNLSVCGLNFCLVKVLTRLRRKSRDRPHGRCMRCAGGVANMDLLRPRTCRTYQISNQDNPATVNVGGAARASRTATATNKHASTTYPPRATDLCLPGPTVTATAETPTPGHSRPHSPVVTSPTRST